MENKSNLLECINCKNLVKKDSKFCSKCGLELYLGQEKNDYISRLKQICIKFKNKIFISIAISVLYFNVVVSVITNQEPPFLVYFIISIIGLFEGLIISIILLERNLYKKTLYSVISGFLIGSIFALFVITIIFFIDGDSRLFSYKAILIGSIIGALLGFALSYMDKLD